MSVTRDSSTGKSSNTSELDLQLYRSNTRIITLQLLNVNVVYMHFIFDSEMQIFAFLEFCYNLLRETALCMHTCNEQTFPGLEITIFP